MQFVGNCTVTDRVTRARKSLGVISVRSLTLWFGLASAPLPVAGARASLIVDHDSRPVAGARVTVTIPGGWESSVLPPAEVTGTSNEKGALPFSVPRVNGALVAIDHPRFAPASLEVTEQFSPDEIRLARGEVWRGRVLASPAGSEPLDGEVCAGGALPPRGWWRRCAAIEDGRFQLEGLPRGAVAVEVQVPGFLPRIETVDPLKKTTVYVDRGVLLAGTVGDARERPLAGALVSSRRSRASSQRDGRFSIAVPSLPATLEVRMPGYRRWVREIGRAAAVDVRLVPGEGVGGVLLGDPRAPLRGAAVEIVRVFDDGSRKGMWSGLERGEKDDFSFDLPEPGRYTLTFRAPGYRQRRLPNLYVGKGAMLPLGVIVLERGAGVRGRVIDGSNGKPLMGALVDLVPAGALLLQTVGQGGLPAAVIDDAGEFLATGFEAGRYLVRLRRANAATFHRMVDLDSAEILDLGTLTLDGGVEIRGRVVGRDSEAGGAVPVRLYDPAREMIEPLATTVSDAAGRFTLARISPGRYRIEAGGERLLAAQEIVVVNTPPQMEIVLNTGGARIEGRVTRAGVPVSGGTIRLRSVLDPAERRGKIVMNVGRANLIWGLPQSTVSAAVDAEGRFALSGAPAGLVRLWYSGIGGETILRSAVLSGTGEVFLPLELEGHPLEGRLVDGSAGTGVRGTVRLFDGDGRWLTDTEAAPDGTFRFTDVQRGVHVIDAVAAGFLPAAARAVEVGAETASQLLQLETGEPGQIEIELLRGDGSGVNGVPVTIFDMRGALIRSLPTQGSGGRRFDDLPPGEYVVGWADLFGGAGRWGPVRVGASRAPAVSRVLERGASVLLRCSHHRCAGAPVELLEVHADGLEMSPLLSGITPALRLSEDGEVSIGRLASGRYRIRLWVAGLRWEKQVTVGSGDHRIIFQ